MTMLLEDPDLTEEVTPPKRRNRWARVLAVTALLFAVLTAGAFAWNSHVQGEYDRRDEAIALLRIKSDKDKRAVIAAHRREFAALDLAHEKALKTAVAKQKRHDTRVLRRVVRRQKAKARREISAARNAGYSSGSAAGYSSGHNDGEDAGLLMGSDGLDCSDDIDVYWLPPCF